MLSRRLRMTLEFSGCTFKIFSFFGHVQFVFVLKSQSIWITSWYRCHVFSSTARFHYIMWGGAWDISVYLQVSRDRHHIRDEHQVWPDPACESGLQRGGQDPQPGERPGGLRRLRSDQHQHQVVSQQPGHQHQGELQQAVSVSLIVLMRNIFRRHSTRMFLWPQTILKWCTSQSVLQRVEWRWRQSRWGLVILPCLDQ